MRVSPCPFRPPWLAVRHMCQKIHTHLSFKVGLCSEGTLSKGPDAETKQSQKHPDEWIYVEASAVRTPFPLLQTPRQHSTCACLHSVLPALASIYFEVFPLCKLYVNPVRVRVFFVTLKFQLSNRLRDKTVYP